MLHRHPLFGLAVLVLAVAVTGCAKASRDSTDAGTPPASVPSETADRIAAAGTDATGTLASRRGGPPSEYRSVDVLKDVYFDFDRAEVRRTDLPTLDRNAGWMLENPKLAILVVGHTDERGSPEYNLALGDRRAKWAVSYLVAKGVPARRFEVVSYGSQRPACQESTEGCWTRNRRAQFLVRAE